MNTSIVKWVMLACLPLVLASCGETKKSEESSEEDSKATVTEKLFGTMPDGTKIQEFTMTNANGLEMKVITYGGIIRSLKTPNKEGELEDIVLGYADLQAYLDENPFFGAIIGRYGNRIAKGKFNLDSVDYQLAQNNIGNHLHGGEKGYDKVVWTGKPQQSDSAAVLALHYTSKDMEEGYPGNLEVVVTYTLANDNSLTFDYKATTDKKTIVNLTQHSYFNLSALDEDILGHELMLNADTYLPVDSTLIPTGEMRAVEGTPFDFTTAKAIGQDINVENQQLTYGLGYDHCWVLNDDTDDMHLAATLSHAKSGRIVSIYTTEPGIQFYSGNFLDGSLTGKNGAVYEQRTGLCLETQHFPDSPNQEGFPSVVVSPGETYHTVTRLEFDVKE